MNLISQKRKRLFRFRLPLREVCCGTLLTFCVGAFAAVTPLTQSAREQINATVIKAASQQVVQLAKAKHWQDYHYKLNVFIPPAIARAQPCPQSPLLRGNPAGMSSQRMMFDVECPSLANWRYRVTVSPDIYVPVVMTREDVMRGEVITADNLMLKKFNLSSSREPYLTAISDVVGMTAKRNLPSLRPVTLSMFQQPLLIKRDQPVTLFSQSGNITVQTQGTALNNGHQGERVRVRNDSSQRIVSGVVMANGSVKTGV